MGHLHLNRIVAYIAIPGGTNYNVDVYRYQGCVGVILCVKKHEKAIWNSILFL